MALEKPTRPSRVKEALGRIYDQHPPYFREYLRRYEEDPTSRVFAPLAEAYRKLGRVDEAITLCLEGLRHHPDFSGGRVALAKCYIDKKLFMEARQELEKVIQQLPENLLAQRLLGDVYLALGDKVSGLQRYKMAQLLSAEDVTLSEKVHQLEREVYQQGPNVYSEKGPEEQGTASAEKDAELVPLSAPVEGAEGERSAKEAGAEDLDSFLSSGTENSEEEAFQVQPVGQIFSPEGPAGGPEITTETLGDLYFSQAQYDRSLRIFEKLYEKGPSIELSRKINACRKKLGMQKDDIAAGQKIALLRSILKDLRTVSS